MLYVDIAELTINYLINANVGAIFRNLWLIYRAEAFMAINTHIVRKT
jgi:hypothetical protein